MVIVVNRNKFSGRPFSVVVNPLITMGLLMRGRRRTATGKQGTAAREWN